MQKASLQGLSCLVSRCSFATWDKDMVYTVHITRLGARGYRVQSDMMHISHIFTIKLRKERFDCTLLIPQTGEIHKASVSQVLTHNNCLLKEPLFSLITVPAVSSSVVTEQFDQGSVPRQPFLLALCRHCHPGHYVHALRSQHGPHHQDTAAPAVKVRRHSQEPLSLTSRDS